MPRVNCKSKIVKNRVPALAEALKYSLNSYKHPLKQVDKKYRNWQSMALSGENKKAIIQKYQINPKDTGSAQVQVANITARMDYLQKHFGSHVKDFHSKQGLLRLVGQRRRLLDYLKRKNIAQYRGLIESLGIRK